jgi:hypothetical protein
VQTTSTLVGIFITAPAMPVLESILVNTHP